MQAPFRSAAARPATAQPAAIRNPMAARPITGQQTTMVTARTGPPPVSVSAQARTSGYKYTSNVRNPSQQMPVQQQQVQQVNSSSLFIKILPGQGRGLQNRLKLEKGVLIGFKLYAQLRLVAFTMRKNQDI